ncbi:MAG: hypothetical protein KGL44_00020 [Sphingomonadales bacterium]|nr:hypothetical protein [Sphingomonadales bacterium]
MRALAFGLSALIALTGCAASAQSDPMATTPATPLSRGEMLAGALAQAASAEQAGDRRALSHAVGVIDRLGAHPLDGADDAVSPWRTVALQDMPPLRGRPLGPGYRSGRIPAGGTESISQLFLSGTGASIALSAPNGGRVAMRVIDPQAKTVCKGEANHGGTCRWVPLFTQRYTIEVANLGAEDVRYFLVVE